MRFVLPLLLLASCAPREVPPMQPLAPLSAGRAAEIERSLADIRTRPDSLSNARQPLPPREASLLEDALAGRPDYVQALRRAAEANIAESNPVVRQSPAAREARVRAEEARLSDLIETRRREQVGQRQQQDRAARDQAAVAACQARGAQIDAAMYNPRSILNIDGAAAAAQARNACLDAYQRTGVMP